MPPRPSFSTRSRASAGSKVLPPRRPPEHAAERDLAPAPTRRRPRGRNHLITGLRQGECEHRPLPYLARDTDRAAVQSEDIADDRQTDPRTFVLAARARVHLVETLEDLADG